jgi:hypothetical protein
MNADMIRISSIAEQNQQLNTGRLGRILGLSRTINRLRRGKDFD